MVQKRKIKKKRATKRRKATRNYVVVSNPSYGAPLKGTRIYFEGPKPKGLKPDGSIKLGKHILEALSRKFQKFRWIITTETDSITVERGIARVRTSQRLLRRMSQEQWDRGRDIKNDIVKRFFATAFGEHFPDAAPANYVPGTLAATLSKEIVPRLSSEDREAVAAFIPEYVAAESVGTVNLLKATAQIETLKGLADDLEAEIDRGHAESFWQNYIKGNILLMQQGYIKALGKLNISIGNTKFPDFSLITHDNYLDILEIKKPDTPMLKFDKSRGNYFWDPEVAKAIIQVENYIENATAYRDAIRSYISDTFKIEIKSVRPSRLLKNRCLGLISFSLCHFSVRLDFSCEVS